MFHNLGYTALLLGVLVVVHEFGHFLVAKLVGVKVLRFSVGFGPRLLGFTRGDTEYRLSVLPLGGYVKMAGDGTDELPPEEAHRGFLAQPPWKRALIVVAGPFFNLAFPLLVYWFVVAGYPQPSTRVMALEPGLRGARTGLQLGDRIVSADGHPVTSFEELKHFTADHLESYGLRVERAGRTRSLTVPAVPNDGGGPVEALLGVSPMARPATVGVPPGSPAWNAGLRTFDHLLSVDGTPVQDEMGVRDALARAHGPTVSLKVLRFASAGLPGTDAQRFDTLTLVVPRQSGEGFAAIGAEQPDLYIAAVVPNSPAQRAGLRAADRLLSVNGNPLSAFSDLSVAVKKSGGAPIQVSWSRAVGDKAQPLSAPLRAERMDLPNEGGPRLMVGLEGYGGDQAEEPRVDRTSVGVLPAAQVALWRVEDVIEQTAVGIGALIVHKSSFDNVGSVIEIYRLTAQSVQEGLEAYLHLMAIISVSLGLMNLLPIPILDGFHLFASAWEAIRRRPIPVRAREIANMVGLAMLILLMVLAVRNDLAR